MIKVGHTNLEINISQEIIKHIVEENMPIGNRNIFCFFRSEIYVSG